MTDQGVPESETSANLLQTFESIPDNLFTEYFGIPKISYDGPYNFEAKLASVIADRITDDWKLPSNKVVTDRASLFDDGIFSTNYIIVPYIYFLYVLEIGITNIHRFYNDEPHIFFPDSTDAYNFAVERSLKKKIGEVRGIRKALELLLTEEVLVDLGFDKDIELIKELEDRDSAVKLLKAFSVDDYCIWKKPFRVRKINPNILY